MYLKWSMASMGSRQGDVKVTGIDKEVLNNR